MTRSWNEAFNSSYISRSWQLQLASYTNYTFSFAGVVWNVSDARHNFVHGYQQRFGVDGAVLNETSIVNPTMGYTNYYAYDLWGNLIYSRNVINPSVNRYHETFNAYYNDGMPPGFGDFRETFSQRNGTSYDNPWFTYNGTWSVANHAYNGTQPIFAPFNQASVFAWTNSTSPNLSIIASVYVAKPTSSTDQRVGLIAHYPGTGLRKWALVLHNSAGGMKLSLLDESISWIETPCTLSYNVWYLFNFTISGRNAWGTATAPGISPCSVSGSFTSSDITSATSFGIYAGGYTALFANVTATTIVPSITGTVFSNSFFQTGIPSASIHSSLAGMAELQNGTGSAPIESYYNYYSWGGLNKTRQLYNPTAGISWLTTSRKYDPYGNLKTLIDARGNSTSYGHSANYQFAYLTSVNQTLVRNGPVISQRYSYNITMGTMLSSVDPNGYNTTYQYDILGRITRVSYPNSLGFEAYSYNDAANFVNITNENGWKTLQIYDGLARLSTVDRFLNGASYSNQTYSYNWQDRTTMIRDPLGNTYNYTYDPLGRATKTVEPNGNITQFVYNDANSTIVSVNEQGIYRCNTYDRMGHLISVIEYSDPYCHVQLLNGKSYLTNYFYDEVGSLRKVTTSNLQSTTYNYNSLNQLTQINYPDNTLANYTYDNNGNLINSLDQNGIKTSRSYDSLNRLINITYYGRTTSYDNYAYDNDSNIVQLKSLNATIGYNYDSRNRVTCETYSVNGGVPGGPCGGGGGGSVAAGTLITLANNTQVPVQNLQPGMQLLSYNVTTAQFTVSTITRMSTVQTGDMMVMLTRDGQPLRTDNATVQKLWVKRADGSIGWLSVTQLKLGDSLFIAQLGLWTPVTSIRDILGQFTMYDIYDTLPGDYLANGYLDPIKAPTHGPSVPGGIYVSGYSFSYYYTGETLAYITYNDYMTASYYYDGLGRVTKLQMSSTSSPTTFSYYPTDRIKGVQYSNGLVGNYSYTKLGQVSRESLNNTSTSPATRLLILNYQYNRTGTVASVVGNSTNTSGTLYTVNEQYGYDILGRLVNSFVKTGSVATTLSYTYDNVGNRLSQKANGVTTNYSYNTLNELTNSSGGTTNSYAYDHSGNLVGENVTGITTSRWTYTWNVQGELLTATNYTSAQGFYAYDGLGRRIESKESSNYLFYGYLGTETLADLGSASPENNYVYADGLRIARVNNAQGANPTTFYYYTDALGSSRLVTSSTKSVLFSDGYLPYGQDNSATGTETYKFTGKPVSQTTGLYYEYQRWYDPSVGRFISKDPIPGSQSNPQSLNPYVYVYNDPSSLTDPSGLYTEFNHSCPDSCTGSQGLSGDWLVSVIIALSEVDTHHFGGAPGGFGMDFDTGRCVYECGARSESSYFSENSGEGETVWSHSDSETTSAETTSPDGVTSDTKPTTSDAVSTADFFNDVEGTRGGSAPGTSGEIGFAPPGASHPDYPGGLAETEAHTPADMSRSDWVNSVKDIANNPVRTAPNTLERPGYLAYGYDTTGYPVRVVIIEKWGGIYTAFRDSKWV